MDCNILIKAADDHIDRQPSNTFSIVTTENQSDRAMEKIILIREEALEKSFENNPKRKKKSE